MAENDDDLTTLDDEELADLEAELAEDRTALRLRQVAVANERTFRATLGTMSPDQQAAFAVRVGGGVGVASERKQERPS